jgi:uncharacterized membrane protein YfcA
MGKTAQPRPMKSTPRIGKRGGLIGIVFGAASGPMTGLVGLSGTPPTMAGLYLLGFPVATVVGTSVFVTIFSARALFQRGQGLLTKQAQIKREKTKEE